MTDHSFASRNGIATSPTFVCRPLRERVQPRRAGRPVEGTAGRGRRDDRVAGAGPAGRRRARGSRSGATIAISTSRIEPSTLVSHGPRSGERKKPGGTGRKRPPASGRPARRTGATRAARCDRRGLRDVPAERGGRVRSVTKRATRERADRLDLEPGPRRDLGDAVAADPCPAEPLGHDARRLQPDARRARVGAPGGSASTTIAPPGASSSPARRSSRIGAPPMPMLPSSSRIVRHVPARGHLRPQRAVDRRRAAPAREPDGDRGEIHPEPALARRRAARPDGGQGRSRGRARAPRRPPGPRCRSRPRAPASGRAAAARAARRRAAAARAGQGRRRAGAARPTRAGARRARRRGGGRRRAAAARRAAACARRARSRRHPQRRRRSRGQLGREAASSGRLGGDGERVVEACRRRAAAGGSPGAGRAPRAARAGRRRCAAVLIGTSAKTCGSGCAQADRPVAAVERGAERRVAALRPRAGPRRAAPA